MPGKRQPLQHGALAWRKQQEFAALESALLSMPTTDSVLVYLQSVCQAALAQGSPLAAATAAVTALQSVPSRVRLFAEAALTSFLLLSQQQVRQGLQEAGAVVDDLAHCSTWAVSANMYAAVLQALGGTSVVYLVDALAWLPLPASTKCSVLAHVMHAQPQLAVHVAGALCPHLPPVGAGDMGQACSLTISTAALTDAQLTGSVPLVLAVLQQLEMSAHSEVLPPTTMVQALLFLCLCVRCGLQHHKQLASPEASQVVDAVLPSCPAHAAGSAGAAKFLQLAVSQLEKRLCEWQGSLQAISRPPGSLISELSVQLGTISTALAEAQQQQVLPMSSIVQIRTRIMMWQAAAVQPPSPSCTPDTADTPVPMFALDLFGVAHASTDAVGAAALHAWVLAQDPSAAACHQNPWVQSSAPQAGTGTELTDVHLEAEMAVSAVTMQQRPPAWLKAPRSTVSAGPLPQTMDTSRSAVAAPAVLDGWQMRMAGYVSAVLTPGMPCWWASVAHPAVVHAAAVDSYGGLRMSLAILEAGAHMTQPHGSSILAPPAVLRSALLQMAAVCMTQVLRADAQHALLLATREVPALSRLVGSVAGDEALAASGKRILVALSNRMIAEQQHAGGLALSHTLEAARLAAAAAELLPSAVLLPEQLLQRLVMDAVVHPGQATSALQLLAGPLRLLPTTCLPAPCTRPAPGGPPALVALLQHLLLHSREHVPHPAQHKALQALMRAVTTPSGSHPPLIPHHEALAQVVLPALEQAGPDTQVLCVLSVAECLLSAVAEAGPALVEGVPCPGLMPLLAKDAAGGAVAGRLLVAVLRVVHELQAAFADQGVLDATSLELASKICSKLVVTTCQTATVGGLQPGVAATAAHIAAHCTSLTFHGVLTVLPLLSADIGGSGHEVEEVRMQLPRILLPSQLWRPSSSASTSAAARAQVLHEQAAAALWFGASEPGALLAACTQHAQDESEVEGASGTSAALQELQELGRRVMQYQDMPLPKHGITNTIARTVVRQLASTPLPQLRAPLVAALAAVLPVSSTAQAGRILGLVLPALLRIVAVSDADMVGWLDRCVSDLSSARDDAEAADSGSCSVLRQALTHAVLGQGCTSCLATAYALHLCSLAMWDVLAAAAAHTAEQQVSKAALQQAAAERCITQLGAHVRALLTPTTSAPLPHSTRWALGLVGLCEGIRVTRVVGAAGLVVPVLRVTLLEALGAALAPPQQVTGLPALLLGVGTLLEAVGDAEGRSALQMAAASMVEEQAAAAGMSIDDVDRCLKL